MGKGSDRGRSPMPGAFAKLAGAFLLAGIATSIAVGSFWPIVLFSAAIYFCLLVANSIEKKHPSG